MSDAAFATPAGARPTGVIDELCELGSRAAGGCLRRRDSVASPPASDNAIEEAL